MSKHIIPYYADLEKILIKKGKLPIIISLLVIAGISLYLLTKIIHKNKIDVSVAMAAAWIVYVFMP